MFAKTTERTRAAVAAVLTALGVCLALGVGGMGGCEGRKSYPQDTPQAVLDSARRMVAEGNAERLTELIYAGSPQEREFLRDIGRVLGSLQRLGVTVQRAYPEELEKVREELAEAAKRGEATSLIGRLSAQTSRQRRGGASGAPDGRQQQQFNLLLRDLFANPFGFLDEQAGRLSVRPMTDDLAALMWDGKPIFGVGLTLRRDEGVWTLSLPTSTPPLNRVMPSTDEGWQVFGELAQIMVNTLDELREEVESGRAPRLEDLAASAGDKAFLPMAMGFLAYERLRNAERKAAQGAPAPAAAPAGGGS